MPALPPGPPLPMLPQQLSRKRCRASAPGARSFHTRVAVRSVERRVGSRSVGASLSTRYGGSKAKANPAILYHPWDGRKLKAKEKRRKFGNHGIRSEQ